MSEGFDSVASWSSNGGVFSWLRSWFIAISAVRQGEGHEYSFWQQHRVKLPWTNTKAVSRKIFPISAHLKAVESGMPFVTDLAEVCKWNTKQRDVQA